MLLLLTILHQVKAFMSARRLCDAAHTDETHAHMASQDVLTHAWSATQACCFLHGKINMRSTIQVVMHLGLMWHMPFCHAHGSLLKCWPLLAAI